jgi:hypothetical protein
MPAEFGARGRCALKRRRFDWRRTGLCRNEPSCHSIYSITSDVARQSIGWQEDRRSEELPIRLGLSRRNLLDKSVMKKSGHAVRRLGARVNASVSFDDANNL